MTHFNISTKDLIVQKGYLNVAHIIITYYYCMLLGFLGTHFRTFF